MSIKRTAETRIRRPAEAARDHILEAAEALLVQSGPLALKLTAVARQAGVATGSILHHFESTDGLRAALMDRMVSQLVAAILAAPPLENDPDAAADAMLNALFDAFETRGAARLAAWLELTGEVHRLTTVQDAIKEVIARRLARDGVSAAVAQDIVLVTVTIAMGVGLFGRSLAELARKPLGRPRKLISALLRSQVAAFYSGSAR
jgi:AcrR family transcriptional regulator